MLHPFPKSVLVFHRCVGIFRWSENANVSNRIKKSSKKDVGKIKAVNALTVWWGWGTFKTLFVHYTSTIQAKDQKFYMAEVIN